MMFSLLSYGFLSVLLQQLHCSSAYLFATGSAPVSSDSEDSWPDYILLYLNNRFTDYALRLTMILITAFALGVSLQTTFPLHSSLIIYGLPDDFTIDSQPIAMHLLHNELIDSCCLGQFYPPTQVRNFNPTEQKIWSSLSATKSYVLHSGKISNRGRPNCIAYSRLRRSCSF